MSICKIKYIEDNYRKEYPELADKLSEIHNNVWKDVINSKLFTQKGNIPTESTYLFSKIGTEANKKQISFINDMTTKYGGKVIFSKSTESGYNTKVIVGVNSLAQLEYDKLQKPIQGSLFNNNPIVNFVNLQNNEEIINNFNKQFNNEKTELLYNTQVREADSYYKQNIFSEIDKQTSQNNEQSLVQFLNQKNITSESRINRVIQYTYNRIHDNGGMVGKIFADDKPRIYVLLENKTTSILAQIEDKIVINSTAILENLQNNININELPNYLEQGLLEELIHYKANKKLTPELIDKIYSELSIDQIQSITKYYLSTDEFAVISRNVVVNEYIRQIVQYQLTGKTTEDSVQILGKMSNTIIQFLKKLFQDIINIYNNNKESIGNKTIDEITNELKNIINNTTEKQSKNNFLNDNVNNINNLGKIINDGLSSEQENLGNNRKKLSSDYAGSFRQYFTNLEQNGKENKENSLYEQSFGKFSDNRLLSYDNKNFEQMFTEFDGSELQKNRLSAFITDRFIEEFNRNSALSKFSNGQQERINLNVIYEKSDYSIFEFNKNIYINIEGTSLVNNFKTAFDKGVNLDDFIKIALFEEIIHVITNKIGEKELKNEFIVNKKDFDKIGKNYSNLYNFQTTNDVSSEILRMQVQNNILGLITEEVSKSTSDKNILQQVLQYLLDLFGIKFKIHKEVFDKTIDYILKNTTKEKFKNDFFNDNIESLEDKINKLLPNLNGVYHIVFAQNPLESLYEIATQANSSPFERIGAVSAVGEEMTQLAEQTYPMATHLFNYDSYLLSIKPKGIAKDIDLEEIIDEEIEKNKLNSPFEKNTGLDGNATLEQVKELLTKETLENINYTIKKTNPDLEIKVTFADKSMFDPKSNSINLNIEEIYALSTYANLPFNDVLNNIINHELRHAQTDFALNKGKNNIEFEDFLKKLKELHKTNPFIDKLRGEYTYKGEPYTYQNIFEMIADHYGNPFFMEYLKNNEFNKERNFLEQLIKLIHDLLNKLGIKTENPNSIYNDLNKLIKAKQLISINKANAGKEQELNNFQLVTRGAASFQDNEEKKKLTAFEEIDSLLLVQEVADIFDFNKEQLVKSIDVIKKAYRKQEPILQDASLKISINKILKDLEESNTNNSTKTIISHIYNTILIFEKLKQESYYAQNIVDNDLKIKTLYGLNSIVQEHEDFLNLLRNIKLDLTSFDENAESILSKALTPEQIKQNSLVVRNLLRVLEQPLTIADNIKGIYLRNNPNMVGIRLYEDFKLGAEKRKLEILKEIKEEEDKLNTNIRPSNQIFIKNNILKLEKELSNLPLEENNNIQDWIAGKNGDISLLNYLVESNTISKSPLVQSLSSQIKNVELQAKDALYPILNKAQTIQSNYLKEEGITNFDISKNNDPFLMEHTVIDKLVWNKEEKRFEEPITHLQYGLLNNYTDDYQYNINLFKKKLEILYFEILNTKDENLINELTTLRENIIKERNIFYKENVENKYIDEVVKGLELLDEEIDGTTLRKYRGSLYEEIEDLQHIIENHDILEEAKKPYLDALQEKQIILNGLLSIYGKKEDSIEYKMAIQAKKYRDALKDYKISTISDINNKLYKREYEKNEDNFKKGLINKAEYERWLSSNTRIEINPEYFKQRTSLAEKVENLRNQLVNKGIITTTSKEKVKAGYNTLKDISVFYRQFDGVIDGNQVKEEESKTIKEIQEQLEKLRNELDVKKNGLTSYQSSQYNKLKKLTVKTPADQDELNKLEELKQAAKINVNIHKDLIKQYDDTLKELLDISEGGFTRYYEEKINELNQQLTNKRIDLMNSDEIIDINENIQYKKQPSGEFKNVINNKIVPESTVIALIEDKYRNEIIYQNEWYIKNHYKKQSFNSKGKPIEINEPLYHWKTSRPANPNFITEKPSLKYYKTTFKENALNEKFKQTPNLLPLPKSNSKYINKDFIKLSKTKTDYLTYLRELYYDKQLNAVNSSAILGDLIPTKRRSSNESTIEFFKGNVINNIKEQFQENFKSTEQDKDLGYVKKDSVANKVIPTYMTSKIDSKNQSKDILGLILDYTYFAEKRKGTVELQAFAESLITASSQYSKTTVDNVINAVTLKDKFKAISGIISGKQITTTTEGIESNETKALKELANTALYGEVKIDSGSPFVEKGADWLMKITAKGIFTLNAFSPLKNTLSAKLQFFINDIATPTEWSKAESTFMSGIKDLFMDINSIGNKSYISQILEMYEGLQGSVFSDISHKVQSNPFQQGTNILTALKDFSEYELQAVFTIVMLQKEKVQLKDGSFRSLYDSYNINNGTLELKNDVDINKFTNNHRYDFVKRLHAVNLKTQGAYRMEEKNNLQKTVGGRLLFFMSQYFVPGVTNRYGKERYYRANGEMQEGFYRTAYRTLLTDWNKYGTNVVTRWKDMSEQEKIGTIKFMKEIGTILALLGLLSMLGGGDPDRFKNSSKLEMFTLALLKGVSSETQTFSPVGGADELYRKIQNPFIVSKTIGNIGKLIIYTGETIIGDDDAFYQKDSGMYKEGDSKAFATLMKLTGFSMSNIFLLDGEQLLKRQENITRIR